MNLPNYITLSRIASIPLLMWLLLSDRFAGAHGERELAAAGLFLLASITDGIDGWLARRRGQITAMGMCVSDSLNLEDLAKACEQEGRWEFMVAGLPLRLPGATGSPWNPIAIF